MNNKNTEIDNLRKAMGTLPSETPKNETHFVKGCSEMEVELVDHTSNPYKTIVAAATATWGNDKYETKWPKLTKENRFKVVLSTLTGNTLPQAMEGLMFTFKVVGVPRHCFDQHARARIGATFYSIGSRDNNKLDSRIILYSKLYDMLTDEMKEHFIKMKKIYEEILDTGKGSWQLARAFLPMSYHHSYHFSMNYLALQGQCKRRMMFCEEEFIVGLHWLLRERIKDKFPLLAEYLRPACDYVKKCVYAKSYGLSNAFGCLFAGCGRWEAGTEYATFNESCSDKETIEKQLNIKIRNKDEWINYTEDDYDKLSDKDKKLFEED